MFFIKQFLSFYREVLIKSEQNHRSCDTIIDNDYTNVISSRKTTKNREKNADLCKPILSKTMTTHK